MLLEHCVAESLRSAIEAGGLKAPHALRLKRLRHRVRLQLASPKYVPGLFA